MCGLVGVYGNLFANDLKFFNQALVADYFRGKHSTGIASVDDKGNPFVFKKAVDPITFLQFKPVDTAISTSKRLIMGHNRHATLGGVNDVNAHPFVQGDITLCHNGTLDNKLALERRFLTAGQKSFDTDSELIAWLFDNYDHTDIIPELEGAFALTWWDESDSTFRIVRNSERPFSYAAGKARVWYASEKLMLEWLLDRNNLDYSADEVKELDVGNLVEFTYDRGTVEKKETSIEVKKPRRRTGYSSYSQNRGGMTNSGSWADKEWCYTQQKWVPKGTAKPSHRSRSFNSHKSSTRSEYEREFQHRHGVQYGIGSEIYAWLTKVKPGSQSKNIVHMEFMLASSPYTKVRAWSVCCSYDKFKDYDIAKTPIGFKLRISAFMKSKEEGVKEGVDDIHIIVRANKGDITPVTDKAAEDAMFLWTDKNEGSFVQDTPEELPEKKSEPSTQEGASQKQKSNEFSQDDSPFELGSETEKFERLLEKEAEDFLNFRGKSGRSYVGFQGLPISSETFKLACDRGCAYCGDPIDAETESLDQEVLFVNHDSVVCKPCQQTEQFKEEYFEFGPELLTDDPGYCSRIH